MRMCYIGKQRDDLRNEAETDLRGVEVQLSKGGYKREQKMRYMLQLVLSCTKWTSTMQIRQMPLWPQVTVR
jgi:hypothetical protein